MMTRTVVAFTARTPVVLNAPPSTELQMQRAELAAASAIGSAAQSTADAAATDADRIAAETAAGLADTNRALVEAMMSNGGVPYANTYAASLPKGVTGVTIGGTAITGATVGEYAITGSGGSITGYGLTLVVTSATTATVRVNNTGLGSGTTPPTLTKPAGATLPAGTTITAVVAPIVADQKAYAYASTDSSTVLFNRNNGGAVAALNNPDGSQISFLNAREFRRFIARFSTWRNTAYAVANPHLLRVSVNLIMADGSTPPDCYTYDIRRDLSTRFIIDIKRVSDNVRMAATTTTTTAAAVATSINPISFTGANGGTGQVTLALYLTAEAIAAGISSASTYTVDWGGGETWGGVQDGLTTTTALNSSNMGLDAASRSQVTVLAEAAVGRASKMFDGSATDTYAKAVFKDVIIGNGDPDDTYFWNYQTMYFAGIPLYRFKARLHSTKYSGAEVARYDYEKATLPSDTDLPAALYMSRMYDGAVLTSDDTGTTAYVELDKSAIAWTKDLTTNTTAVATKIAKGKVQTTGETEAAWLARNIGHYKRVTIGATNGDYATVVAAIAATENAAAAGTITRSTYPSCNFGSPERPILFEVVDALTEQVTPFTYLGISQSPLRLPHGSILKTRPDTLIYMDTAGATAPVVEMNFTARIMGGGTIEQRGDGYIIHVDNSGAISHTSTRAPFDLRRKIQTVFGDIILLKTEDNAVPHVGAGISNGQHILFDGTIFKRPNNTAQCDYIYVHNSPSETVAGTIELRNVTSDVTGATAAMLTVAKTHSSSVRHSVIVSNSNCPRLKVNNTAGGGAGFIRRGPMTGITVVGDMEP